MRTAGLLALGGALMAGCFGIVHDQITYTISPEYFTRMKFQQFHGADFGFPPRVFVAEIGFLATWWVGLISAWFLARIALRKFESPVKKVVKAIAQMIAITVAFAITGYFVGPWFYGNGEDWTDALRSIGVTDKVAFSRVAAIHLGSYSGALIGWIAVTVMLLRSPISRLASEREAKK